MPGSNHGERIATLEERSRQLRKSVDTLTESIETLTTIITHLDSKIAGWKGVAAGAAIAVSVLWTFALAIKDYLIPG